MKWIARLICLICVIAALGSGAAAQAQTATVLTVPGRISAPGGQADFDLAALERLGTHRLRTTTPWTEGVQEFDGALLRDLLAAVGAQGGALAMSALNYYTVDFPRADAQTYDVIIAFRRNGQAMIT